MMRSHSNDIVVATMAHTLRPKGGDRERVIASALRYVVQHMTDYEEAGCGRQVIFPEDLWEVIDELEEYAQRNP
jgi:hypothetical protein